MLIQTVYKNQLYRKVDVLLPLLRMRVPDAHPTLHLKTSLVCGFAQSVVDNRSEVSKVLEDYFFVGKC